MKPETANRATAEHILEEWRKSIIKRKRKVISDEHFAKLEARILLGTISNEELNKELYEELDEK